jgi:hypothetical protein
MSVGHVDGTGGKVGLHRNGLLGNGTTTISAKRGIQWDRFQIGVSRRGRFHGKKCLLKNDSYDCDQGKERNPIE